MSSWGWSLLILGEFVNGRTGEAGGGWLTHDSTSFMLGGRALLGTRLVGQSDGSVFNKLVMTAGGKLPLGLVALCAYTHAAPAAVFTDKEVKECTRIRTPVLISSSPQHKHVLATCCGENACGHKTFESSQGASPTLDDNHKEARIIMKSSSDMGRTWGKTQFLAGGDKGYAGVQAIYVRDLGELVVQYHKGEDGGGKVEHVYQVKSKDHGATWERYTEITHMLEGCGGGTAGQRVQTESGRLLWYGDGCMWYSDDHGATYNVSKHIGGMKNEVSFASLGSNHNRDLYANGRAMVEEWKPYRVDYVSNDDGLSWSKSKSVLKDSVSDGQMRECERSLVYDPSFGGVLYSAEPEGTKQAARTKLVVSCSTDKGRTWPHSINLNGDHFAGYSGLAVMRQGTELLAVWDHEAGDTHTVGEQPLFEVIDTSWCVSKGNRAAGAVAV